MDRSGSTKRRGLKVVVTSLMAIGAAGTAVLLTTVGRRAQVDPGYGLPYRADGPTQSSGQVRGTGKKAGKRGKKGANGRASARAGKPARVRLANRRALANEANLASTSRHVNRLNPQRWITRRVRQAAFVELSKRSRFVLKSDTRSVLQPRGMISDFEGGQLVEGSEAVAA
jgi:hypothetical protein